MSCGVSFIFIDGRKYKPLVDENDYLTVNLYISFILGHKRYEGKKNFERLHLNY